MLIIILLVIILLMIYINKKNTNEDFDNIINRNNKFYKCSGRYSKLIGNCQ
jgi:hypothetical protein